jgi:ATP-binding cassette subfamily C protein
MTNRTERLTWEDIRSRVLRHKTQLIWANIIALIAALLSVPIPLMMPLMVDEVLLDNPGAIVATINSIFPPSWHGPVLSILVVLLVTLLLRLGTLLFGVIQSRQFTLIAKDVTYQLRHLLLQRLNKLSMAEYETMGSGAVTSHLVTDIGVLDEFIGVTISRFIVAALTLVGVSVVLFWMHWPLAVFILLVNPVVVYFTVRMGKKVKQLKSRENSAFAAFQDALTETLDAIQQIRASNRARYFLQKVDDQALAVKRHASSYAWRSDAAARLSFFIFLVGFEVFRAVSMLMVVFSGLTIGKMMAVFGYLWFMMTPVQEILGIQYSLFSARGALERLNKLLALNAEPEYPHLHNPFAGKETVAVSVRDLSFAYGDGPPILDHLNLDIQAGEKVALVGASGGGKSTLVQVILGLYPPTSGKVCFDGIPHDEIGLDVIRDNVATVLQQPAMFNGTVRINLTLGRDKSDDELWQALEVAQLKATIEELPGQLDAVIGKQGVRLSGGQRQRLAIARMILADPKVVILDEATSSLDTETEARVHKALQSFLKGRTTLIIAHRLTAVKQADKVYVFDNGGIIEQGHHDELIQSRGLYQKLYGQLQDL